MSEFTDILTAVVNIKRFTPYLLDNINVAASLSANRQPEKSCRLALEIDGCTVSTGLVTVSGNTIETFSFTNNGFKVGIKDFTSVSSILVSGISNGFIQVKAVSKTGQPVNQEKDIYNSLAVRFEALEGSIRMMAPGEQKKAEYKMYAAPDKILQENDLVYAVSGIVGITVGLISFVDTLMDFDGATDHIECEIMTP
ncbi:MAG: hypothetical protein HY761_10030 [Candidatus Omnitrophica bacterium]|nr:hypothetical protein [Candidatus Omnitrophota bacterium]